MPSLNLPHPSLPPNLPFCHGIQVQEKGGMDGRGGGRLWRGYTTLSMEGGERKEGGKGEGKGGEKKLVIGASECAPTSYR